MNVPEDLKYAETHEWIRMEGEVGTVGITDHAQQTLGDLVLVDAFELGGAEDVPLEAWDAGVDPGSHER